MCCAHCRLLSCHNTEQRQEGDLSRYTLVTTKQGLERPIPPRWLLHRHVMRNTDVTMTTQWKWGLLRLKVHAKESFLVKELASEAISSKRNQRDKKMWHAPHPQSLIQTLGQRNQIYIPPNTVWVGSVTVSPPLLSYIFYNTTTVTKITLSLCAHRGRTLM